MFGQMNCVRLLDLPPEEAGVGCAVARLLEATDHPEVSRWIQFPQALLVFLVVAESPDSGAFYILDRKTRTWFMIDFEDENYGGYNLSHFDLLVKNPPFLRLVEQPWLLECDGGWYVEPGQPLRRRFDDNA